jgi:hypothetical protein
MLCPNCRKEVEATASFCKYCGTRLSSPAATPEVQPDKAFLSLFVPPESPSLSEHFNKFKELNAITTRSMFLYPFVEIYLLILKEIEFIDTNVNNPDKEKEVWDATWRIVDLLNPQEIRSILECWITQFPQDEIENDSRWLGVLSSQNSEVGKIVKKYELTSSHLNWIRSQINSLLSPLFRKLNTADVIYREIKLKDERTKDITTAIREGTIGATMGVAIGSLIFPGIGTILGGLAGGFLSRILSQGQKQQHLWDAIHKDLLNWFQEFFDAVIVVSKDIEKLYRDIFQRLKVRDRRIYNEIQAAGLDATSIFLKSLRQEWEMLEKMKDKKIADDPASPSLVELITDVENFLKSYNQIKKKS